jgi:hypothetical protein
MVAMRPAIIGKVPPPCEKMDVRAPRQGAVEEKADDRARSVEGEFDHRLGHAFHQVEAAIGRGRVEIDDGLAPVELVEDGRDLGIARPHAAEIREQPEPIDAERAIGIVDLGERALDIGQRQCREDAEPALMVARQSCGIVVADAGEAPRLLRVAEPHAGRRDR